MANLGPNNCTGNGSCLQQTGQNEMEAEGFCPHSCEAFHCATKGCNAMFPKWILDTNVSTKGCCKQCDVAVFYKALRKIKPKK